MYDTFPWKKRRVLLSYVNTIITYELIMLTRKSHKLPSINAKKMLWVVEIFILTIATWLLSHGNKYIFLFVQWNWASNKLKFASLRLHTLWNICFLFVRYKVLTSVGWVWSKGLEPSRYQPILLQKIGWISSRVVLGLIIGVQGTLSVEKTCS